MSFDGNPVNELGVYETIEDVPPKHRLENFESSFKGRDVWKEHIDGGGASRLQSDRKLRDLQRVGNHWKNHCNGRGFHHSLPHPSTVEKWFEALLDEVSLHTAYVTYFTRVYGFFRWLLYHPSYPHYYNPVTMAAANYDSTEKVWNYRYEFGGW